MLIKYNIQFACFHRQSFLHTKIFISFLLLFLLQSVTLAQITISGAQSDTLDAGEYIVEDDIWVNADTLWYLRPGVILRFMDGVEFRVYGALYSYGEEGDSIYYEAYDENSAWRGVDLLSEYYGSRFRYTVIEGSNDNGIQSCWGSSPLNIKHCRISNNSDDDGDGGGIWAESALIDTIYYTTISDNIGNGCYVTYCSPRLYECLIKNNSESGIFNYGASSIINRCQITENQNSGIKYRGTSTDIDSSIISYNTAENGGGIYSTTSGIIINRSLIIGNSAQNNGGGGYADIYYSSIAFHNCILTQNTAENYGSAIYSSSGNTFNSIIFNNYESETTVHVFENYLPFHNIFFANDGDDFYSESLMYYEVGEIDTFNLNNHPSDRYFNLFTDPLLIDPDNGDYHLLATSPCIDAGHPLYPLDNDSTINDIGIHYFNQNSSMEEFYPISNPAYFSINSIYPNPFNSTVTISINIGNCNNSFQYSVYDVLGRLISKKSIKPLIGLNNVTWVAPNHLSSGIYFFQIVQNEYAESQRILLVR